MNTLNNNPHVRQFVRYVIAGAVAASLELSLFLFLIHAQWWHVAANTVAFSAAVVFGFFTQKYFTFRDNRKKHVSQAAKFALVVAVGFILTQLFTWFFIDVLHWWPVIAKCTQLVLVLFWNYTGQKMFTFRN